MGCSSEQLIEVGPSKLDKLAPYVTEENKVQMLNTASTLSRSDLHTYLTNEEPEYNEAWRSILEDIRQQCQRLLASNNVPNWAYDAAHYLLLVTETDSKPNALSSRSDVSSERQTDSVII